MDYEAHTGLETDTRISETEKEWEEQELFGEDSTTLTHEQRDAARTIRDCALYAINALSAGERGCIDNAIADLTFISDKANKLLSQ